MMTLSTNTLKKNVYIYIYYIYICIWSYATSTKPEEYNYQPTTALSKAAAAPVTTAGVELFFLPNALHFHEPPRP